MAEISLSPELIAEIRLLLQFPLHSLQTGLKLHSTANTELLAAAERLYHKGMITQADGGYLTDRGLEATMSAVRLINALQPVMH